jgi:hypothetical protein
VLPHRVKRHRSATAIVREFLGPQLSVIPEELVWVPAHPSYPDDGGFTYDEMLAAVRKQRHWAFVRVPKEEGATAVIHFYASPDVSLSKVARMLGHELGHISGDILDDEAEEERRADRYGAVAAKVLEMLSAPERRSSRSTSVRAGRASRPAPAADRGRGASRPSSPRPGRTPTPGARPQKKSRAQPKG